MIQIVSPVAYGVTVGLAALIGAVSCIRARSHPGRWFSIELKILGIVLLADACSWVVTSVSQGPWSPATDLPLPLCDMAAVVAAIACWWPLPVLIELTYFWGLAGTLQAVITPDLSSPFPHIEFFQYLIGHLAIVIAAVWLVVGLRQTPRPYAIPRVYIITAAYTALVGMVDWATGADYMFLRSPPSSFTLLQVLGPWPWYIFSAAGVAVVLLVILDAPFWRGRRRLRHTGNASTHPHPGNASTHPHPGNAGTPPHPGSAGSPLHPGSAGTPPDPEQDDATHDRPADQIAVT